MEIEFFGGNCFRIKTKQTTIILDDNLSLIGKKTISNDKSVALFTAPSVYDKKTSEVARLVIDTPGEYEVGDITVTGLEARAHIDDDGQHTATVFQLMHNGQTISFVGHIHPEVSDRVIELISGTDVLVVPVGGNGFTLDSIAATSLIKKAEPTIVIPSQYYSEGFNFEVPASPLEEFAKVSSLSIDDEQESLKLSKSTDDVSTQTKVVVLKIK